MLERSTARKGASSTKTIAAALSIVLVAFAAADWDGQDDDSPDHHQVAKGVWVGVPDWSRARVIDVYWNGQWQEPDSTFVPPVPVFLPEITVVVGE